MIKFNELEINEKCIILDISVINLPYYEDVYLDTILIDNQDTYMPNGPSGNPLFKYTVGESDTLVSSLVSGINTTENDSQERKKHLRIEVSETELGKPIYGNLFFIYVLVSGTPSPDTPCGMDNTTTMGVGAYLKPFYDSMMCYVKEIGFNCDIPKNFIDIYLSFKALELSLETCHYSEAIDIWNRNFKNIGNTCTTNKSSCKCHG